MANYLVTGVAGFIGARVTQLLLADNHGVTGVDSINDAYDVRLKRWRLDRLQQEPGFTFLELDIRDPLKLRQAFSPDLGAVVNLAARAGVRHSVEFPQVYFETNLTGTLNLLGLAREFGVPKFVLASTSSVYGSEAPRPFAETSDTNHPLSPYAASKKAAETLVYTYSYLHDLDATVLRYFTVYGPAGRPDMSIFRFIRSISEGEAITVFGDGTQERDFTHVDDIARGTVAALRPLGYEIINLGSDRPSTLVDVISLIEAAVGSRAKIEYAPRHTADVMATWADIGLAKRLLDWQPAIALEDGVTGAVRWYMDNREWAHDIL